MENDSLYTPQDFALGGTYNWFPISVAIFHLLSCVCCMSTVLLSCYIRLPFSPHLLIQKHRTATLGIYSLLACLPHFLNDWNAVHISLALTNAALISHFGWTIVEGLQVFKTLVLIKPPLMDFQGHEFSVFASSLYILSFIYAIVPLFFKPSAVKIAETIFRLLPLTLLDVTLTDEVKTFMALSLTFFPIWLLMVLFNGCILSLTIWRLCIRSNALGMMRSTTPEPSKLKHCIRVLTLSMILGLNWILLALGFANSLLLIYMSQYFIASSGILLCGQFLLCNQSFASALKKKLSPNYAQEIDMNEDENQNLNNN